MLLINFLPGMVSFASRTLSEGGLAGGDVPTLPAWQGFTLMIVLVTVLVLALIRNARVYKSPFADHETDHDAGHSQVESMEAAHAGENETM